MEEDKQNVDLENMVVFCRRCGRPLKGNASKEIGFGPRSYRLWKAERKHQISLFEIEEGD